MFYRARRPLRVPLRVRDCPVRCSIHIEFHALYKDSDLVYNNPNARAPLSPAPPLVSPPPSPGPNHSN